MQRPRLRQLPELLGDGVAMSLTSALAAVAGMLSWLVAARVMPQAELGMAAAFVSAFLLVAGCSELNLGVGLMRWLPRAGPHAEWVMVRCGLAVSLVAATIASAYLLLPGSGIIVMAAEGVGGGAAGAVVVYMVACVAWALFYQQDFVLAGLGRSWWTPVRMSFFAISRLLIVVGVGSALTVTAIVWSWLIPVLLCVLVAGLQSLWFARRHQALPGDMAAGELPSRRAVLSFLGPAYAGQMGTAVMLNQLPLLVTFRFGPEQGAAFFVVWQAITVVDVAAQYFAYSLAAGIAREPHRSDELMTRSRRRLLLLAVPVLVIGILLARPALSVFGPGYAQESLVLQILLVGVGFRLLVVHRLGEHQALGRSVRFARLSLTTTALVLGSFLLVPSDLVSRLTGGRLSSVLLPIAGSYLAVQVACACAVLLAGLAERRRARQPADLRAQEAVT